MESKVGMPTALLLFSGRLTSRSLSHRSSSGGEVTGQSWLKAQSGPLASIPNRDVLACMALMRAS